MQFLPANTSPHSEKRFPILAFRFFSLSPPEQNWHQSCGGHISVAQENSIKGCWYCLGCTGKKNWLSACQKKLIDTHSWVTTSHVKMKISMKTRVRLCDAIEQSEICNRCFQIHWVIYERRPCLGFLFSLPFFLFSCSSAVKWTPLLLWGRVARLLVLVRRCMNQSGDRAAGWMADATARMLFNQAALPSNSQGETLHRQMKEKGPSNPQSHAYCIHAGTHVHGPTLIPLISQGVTPRA